MPLPNDTPATDGRLDGWEQIAAYLQVTSKTAQSYEKQAPPLPVHREGARGMRGRVFALRGEIDEWRAARHIPPEREMAEPAPGRRPQLLQALVAIVVIAVLTAVVTLTRKAPPEPQQLAATSPAGFGRLFWRRASESAGPPRRFRLPGDFATHTATASSDGRYLYVGGQKKEMYILDARTGSVRSIPLVEYPVALAVDEKRSIAYVGAKNGAVAAIDLSSGRVREVLQARGVIHDLTISPGGEVVYLALLHAGAMRLRLFPSPEWTRITGEVCPSFVRLDHSGDKLMVSYRCGGPGGRPGHDAVEIFDAGSGKLLDSLSGPPIVGSEHVFSPDGLTLWISAGDACSSPRYDHQGCPAVPSGVIHLYRLSDRRIIRSIPMPLGYGTTISFLAGGSRVLSSGETVRVLRAADLSLLEAQPFGEPAAGVASRDGRSVFFMLNPNKVEVVEAEPMACGDLGPGSVQFHAMDGSGADAIENARVVPEMGLTFGPGMVGQALRLSHEERTAEIRAPTTFRFGARDSTMAMYVKLEALVRDASLLEYGAEHNGEHWRLSVQDEGRLRFEFQAANKVFVQANGTTSLTQTGWRHVAVSKSARTIRIFVDGKLEAEAAALADLRMVDSDAAIRLGWSGSSRARLNGWLDEVAMWDRELQPSEVAHLAGRRLGGPCKP